MRQVIILVLSLAAAVAWIGGTFVWLREEREMKLVQILASREAELGLPIYAQFIATQSIALERPAEITKLIFPIVFSGSDQMRVRLYENGRIINTWSLQETTSGIKEVELALPKPMLLSRRLEVQFDGSLIDPGSKDSAPRVFIEMDDEAYPAGNYRVADNQKKGDIGLTVIEQRSRWQLFQERWRSRPSDQTGRVMLWLAAGVLFIRIPEILARPARAGKSTRTGHR